jgi:putative PIN family toxin of toxin-antitoxin system
VRVILDTNVVISGVFFTGVPYYILKAWRDGTVHVVVSPEILGEYQRVGGVLAKQFPGVDLDPVLNLFAAEAELTVAPPLPEPVCDDPDDDKFLACALASKTKIIISGDKQLLRVSGYRGIEVIRPRTFVDEYLSTRKGS